MSGDEQAYAVKTWRYLRLAMPLLILGLGVSVLYERLHAPGCWQRSISAYYYTPVHGVFVGAVLAVAVCLLCLRGNTDLEDVLLNFAGMFAAAVALVPTPKPKTACSSAMDAMEDRSKNVGNNVIALLAVGAVALLIVAFLARRKVGRQGLTKTDKIGYGAAILVGITTVLVFGLARGTFEKGAHYTAAIAMFACIFAVVELNAWDFKVKPAGKWVQISYHTVGVTMALAVPALAIAFGLGWNYWLISLETALITLFAAFWVVQTVHLWTPGLRERKDVTQPGKDARVPTFTQSDVSVGRLTDRGATSAAEQRHSDRTVGPSSQARKSGSPEPADADPALTPAAAADTRTATSGHVSDGTALGLGLASIVVGGLGLAAAARAFRRLRAG